MGEYRYFDHTADIGLAAEGKTFADMAAAAALGLARLAAPEDAGVVVLETRRRDFPVASGAVGADGDEGADGAEGDEGDEGADGDEGAEGWDWLFFDVLAATLELSAVDKFLVAEVSAELAAGSRLCVAWRGEPYDPGRHRCEHEVKAVTCHALLVQPPDEANTMWRGQAILDI